MGIIIGLPKQEESKKDIHLNFWNIQPELRSPFLPAEWYQQSGVQLTWPHVETDWAYILPEVEECFIQIAHEIAQRELVLIVTPEPEKVKETIGLRVNMDNVRFLKCDTNDTWARDHGAITRIDGASPTLLDFSFNGWGLKFASDKDNLITRHAVDNRVLNGTYENRLNFILEGGSIESDGMGSLLTTSKCLLSPNRNGGMNKVEIEEYLKSTFHLQQILWLDHGYLAGDDTDSHIDTLARFCSPDTIAYVKCTDETDEHFEALTQMEEQLLSFRTLSGDPYKLFALPMPDAIVENGERLPATYANFLIINKTVLYPTYHQPTNDQEAQSILHEAFPDFEIVGIDCCPLIKQHGSLHCVTMQYPMNVIK